MVKKAEKWEGKEQNDLGHLYDLSRKGELTPEQAAILWRWEYDKVEFERRIERQLLPCPFCGSPVEVEAELPAYVDGCFDAFTVRCTSKDCEFSHFADYEQEEYLIKWWNRRPSK